jgi:hypothetical protein
MPFNWFEA